MTIPESARDGTRASLPGINDRQGPISESLYLSHWGLESTFSGVDLYVERVSRDLLHNNSQITGFFWNCLARSHSSNKLPRDNIS